MAEFPVPIPAFLPGMNRDWNEHQAVAYISDAGEIRIVLHDKSAGLALAKQALEGVLFQVSFDYKMPLEVIDQIRNRYKEPEDNAGH